MGDDGERRGDRARVLIAGAGIAGVESALALRDLAGELVEVEMCDPRREFAFRPFAVGEPYGAAGVFRYDMEALAARCGAAFHADGIVSAEPEQRRAVTRGGERLGYDYLLLANGARMPPAIPGAVTFWGAADEGEVGEALADLRAGRLRSLAFTMPVGGGWVFPLYELALLGARELARTGARTRLTVVTPEKAPLELFGRRAGERMSRLLGERGVGVVTGAHPVAFEAGRLRLAPDEEIEADAVIGLPRLEGRRVSGIPHDPEGFVGVDEHGRVAGLERVFAAGDLTAFPVKQRGVATQQADAAAGAIAREAGADVDPEPFDPILGGIHWAGRKREVTSRYLTPFLDSLSDEPAHAVGSSF